jgi:ABC-type Fe3+-hydroxamate transport system substrate-binding protein
MKSRGAVSAFALLLVAAVAGCGDSGRPATGQADRNNTAVLGGYGKGPQAAAPAETLTDAQGKPIAPPHHQAQMAKTGPDTALALWVQDDHVVAATYAGASGWSAPQPLEEIYGQASDPRVASSGNGVAMAVWRHTVGKIESLRYSRFETAAGWAVPDVMPGALPRPRSEGAGAAPQLQMDAQGQVVAEWPSGFATGETQVARYVPGQGWSRASSEPVAAASSAPVTSVQ